MDFHKSMWMVGNVRPYYSSGSSNQIQNIFPLINHIHVLEVYDTVYCSDPDSDLDPQNPFRHELVALIFNLSAEIYS